MKTSGLTASFAVLVAVSMSTPVAAQVATPDSAQVVLQSADVSPAGRLTFSGRGFVAGEGTAVTIDDVQGTPQAQLEPVKVEADGEIYRVSVPVPGGLSPGGHVLHITGMSSGRFGHAAFNLQWQPPAVHLDSYTGKPAHTIGFSGSGFVPGEPVDIYLGDQTTAPLITVNADNFGELGDDAFHVPSIGAGDYKLTFVGRTSQTPVSVGLNVQGFHPWVVLTNYYISPRSAVGFIGQDFVPGEAVQVYLNTRLSQPVVQVAADAAGQFAAENAFALPDLTGDNALIFVGQQSQTEITTSFSVATP